MQCTLYIYTYSHHDEIQEYKWFKRTHDIYAFGVGLLEIRRLRSFIDEVIEQQRTIKEFFEMQMITSFDLDVMWIDSELAVEFIYKTSSWEFIDIFEKRTNVLDSFLGRDYGQVVVKCLNWEFEKDNKMDEVFWSEICDKLWSLHIRISGVNVQSTGTGYTHT